MADGRTLIFMGDGRGKSAAALGTALRRASRGGRVVVIQFLKARDLVESAIMERLEPEIKFFRFERSDDDYLERTREEQEEDAANMRSGLKFARKVLATRMCDLLILDEVVEVVNKGIISAEELRETVEGRGETDLILTGCGMDTQLCSLADEVIRISRAEASDLV